MGRRSLAEPSSIFAGDESSVQEHTRELEPLVEVPRAHWRPLRPALADLLQAPTDAAIAAAYHEHAYTMREIGERLGIHYATVSRRIRRHELPCRNARPDPGFDGEGR